MKRKGIILAGGAGSRLQPMTSVVVKQLLPVYDKPMIFYPLSTLMLAGVTEILIITTPADLDIFKRLLGDGTALGISLTYAVQPKPEGIAQALLIARDFLAGAPSALILGDNIFYGSGIERELTAASAQDTVATIFAYRVNDPERYGVVRLDARGEPELIEEKPKQWVSNFAVTGLYFLPANGPEIAAGLTPSARGELEITDVNTRYMKAGKLACRILGRGYAWFDAGTPDSLLEAGAFVQSLSRRQGLRLSCPEEIAARMGLISVEQLRTTADALKKGEYGQYLLHVATELDENTH